MLAKRGIRSSTLMMVFYLPMVELGHIPYRHMVKEYEDCALYSSLILSYSFSASLCSHRVIHIKGSYKRVSYQVLNLSHSPSQRGPLGLPYNGEKKLIMTFLRFDTMSIQPTNLKSIIPLLEGYYYGFRLQHS